MSACADFRLRPLPYDRMGFPDPSTYFIAPPKRFIRKIVLDQQPLVILIARIEPRSVDMG